MARRASDRDPALDATPDSPPTGDANAPVSVLADGHPDEYIRVRHPITGDHYTTTRVLAHKAGAHPLDGHAAVDQYGRPLPRKPNTTPRKES